MAESGTATTLESMSANDGFNGGNGRPTDPQQPEQLGSTWGAVQWQDDQAAAGSPTENPVVTPPESAANGSDKASGQMPSLPDLSAFGAGFAAAGREDAAAAGEEDAPIESSQQSEQQDLPERQDQPEQQDQPEPNVQFGDAPAPAQQQDAADEGEGEPAQQPDQQADQSEQEAEQSARADQQPDAAAQPETHEQHDTPDEPEAAADPAVNFGSEADENATRAYDTQAFQSDAFASASEQQNADKTANDQPTEVFQRDEFGSEQVVGPYPNDAQADGNHPDGNQAYGAQSYGAQTYGGADRYSQPYSAQPENQDGPEFTQAAFTQQPYGEAPQAPQEQQPYNQQYGQQGDYQQAPYLAGGAPAPFQNAGPVPMHPADEQESHHSEPSDKKRRRRKSKSHQADAAAVAPAAGGKKKRRTGLIVTIAIIAVLAIAAAVLVPLYLHLQNQQRGDELAQEFNEKVKAYEQSWGEDALAAASGPEDFAKVAGGKRESIFVMSADQKKQFEAVCSDVQASKDARQKLADTKAPELPKDEGARASEAYKKAEKKSADLSGKERAKATEFLDEGDNLLSSMESLCGNLGPYLDANQKLRDIGDKDLPKTITVENGGSIVSDDGTVEWKCTAPEGCRDLYHKDTRTKYADVIDSMYTDYYNTLADLFEKQCFADDFAQVCSESVEPFREAAKKSKAYTDYLRNTEPVAEVGKSMYPDEEKLLKEASGAQYAAEEALVNAWRAQDGDNPPASMGDTPASIEAYYQAKQDKVRELAAAVGDGK